METPPSKRKGEHYNLRWHSYANNLVQVLLEHQHHENLVDVTLCCEGQFIKGHKLVLSACSDVFQNMFKVHTVQHPVIVLNGIKFKDFKYILEFMYRGEVQVLDADLEGVLTLGENLQVKGLSSVKYKLQMAEELKVTDKQDSASTDSTPNSISSSTSLTSKSILNSRSISQPKQKGFLSKNQPKEKSEVNCGNERLHTEPDEHVHSGIKKVQTTRINFNAESNKNVSKLESILTDANEGSKRKKFKPPEVHSSAVANGSNSVSSRYKESSQEADKNSRPANAFMIFANEWRKKLAVEHPEENNKGISVRLGNMWKSLSDETKQSYYLAARKVELEHKMKYPEKYIFKPEEPKKRKMTRRKTIDSISHLVSVNLHEYDDDEDDLQIIEVNDDPINVPDSPAKKNRYHRKTSNT